MKKDLQKAQYWLEKAAAQGQDNAARNLKNLIAQQGSTESQQNFASTAGYYMVQRLLEALQKR